MECVLLLQTMDTVVWPFRFFLSLTQIFLFEMGARTSLLFFLPPFDSVIPMSIGFHFVLNINIQESQWLCAPKLSELPFHTCLTWTLIIMTVRNFCSLFFARKLIFAWELFSLCVRCSVRLKNLITHKKICVRCTKKNEQCECNWRCDRLAKCCLDRC